MSDTRVITLLTDFGEQDGFVGTMKGVILGFAPDAQIVDLSHGIKPHDVDAGAFVLRCSHRFFPAGTVHVAVIDPGVGTSRRILAARAGGYLFLAPDNGLLKYIWHEYCNVEVHAVEKTSLYLPSVSHTFHGRDIFAPLAGRLAVGLELDEVGPTVDDYIRGEVPQPVTRGDELIATVLYVDRFGNLITNVPAEMAADLRFIALVVGDRSWPLQGLASSYAEAEQGVPVALLGSADLLELAVKEGSAARFLGVQAGDTLRLRIEKGN